MNKYNIIIDKLYFFDVFNEFYLYGLNSCSLYKIKNDYKELIDLIIKFPQIRIESNKLLLEYFNKYPEFIFYLKREKIISKYTNIGDVSHKKIRPFIDSKEIKQVTFIVSQKCNMSCKYCYVSENLKNNILMSWDVIKKAIDFILDHSSNSISFHYFGGEPLLNFKVIKKATQYIISKTLLNKKKVSFSLVTNGTIINQENINFFKKYKFRIGISLDGPKFIHDSLRIFPNGEGSYDKILNNISKYYSQITRINTIKFHPVIHYKYYEFISQIYDFFVALEKKYIISFYEFQKINLVDSRDLFKNTNQYFDEYIKTKYIYFKKVFEECKSLNSLKPIIKRERINVNLIKQLNRKQEIKYSCGSGISTITIFPNGDIGGCSQLDPSFFPNSIYGNIKKGLENIDENLRLEPYKALIKAEKVCKDCWLRNICGGSCPSLNYYYGKINIPDVHWCEIQKNTFKLSVWLKHKLKEEGLWIEKKE